MPCGQDTNEILLVSVYVCDWNKICGDFTTSVTIECPQNDTTIGTADVAGELQEEMNKRNFQRSLALASIIMKTFELRQHLSSLDFSKRQIYLLCSKAAINTLEYYSRSLFRVPYLLNEVFDVLSDVLNIFPSEVISDRMKAALHRLIVVMVELLEKKKCRRMSPFSEFWQVGAGTRLLIRPGNAECYSLSERQIKILLNVYELLKREMILYERYNHVANKQDTSEALLNLMLTSVDIDYYSSLELLSTTGNTAFYGSQIYAAGLNNEPFRMFIRRIGSKGFYVVLGIITEINSWLCKNEEKCHLDSFNVFMCIHSPSTFLEESDIKRASLGLPLSPIIHFKIWTLDNELERQLNNKSVIMTFSYLTRIDEVDKPQCIAWNTYLWEATPCLNLEITQERIECNCLIRKYIGVFRKSENTESSTVNFNSNVLQDLLTGEAVHVTLGFNATFKGEDREIESHIRYHLAYILEVEESRIINIELISDFKVVTFVIKSEHISMVLSRLENLVRKKELRFVDQDGNLAEVIPHLFFVNNVSLPLSSENRTKDGIIIYILVAVSVVVSVLMCIIITLRKKMKQRKMIGVHPALININSVFTRPA
ncbi:uncharacterized protein LOC143227175 isoform X1 [Tachypleus tridentatus]|uniref:uncharacterized protein LOC143227175 isoform X1 n=1 Tax=Tachypleus tridentatus TaxID=6853 RepID=UPI003FD5C7D7